jgi:hypothetical protein
VEEDPARKGEAPQTPEAQRLQSNGMELSLDSFEVLVIA